MNTSRIINTVVLGLALSLATAETRVCRADEPEYPYAIFIVKGLGTFSDRAWAVNNTGVIGGHSFPPSLTGYLPFVDDGNITLQLGTFGGADGEVRGISDTGLVVGWAENPSGDRRPFLWDPMNRLQDLGTLGPEGAFATDINVIGQITGATDMPVACSPKTDPEVMRVPLTSGRGREILRGHEKETTYPGTDYRQAS